MRASLIVAIALTAVAAPAARADAPALPAHVPLIDASKASVLSHARFAALGIDTRDGNAPPKKLTVTGEYFLVGITNGPKGFDYKVFAAAAKAAGWTVLLPDGYVAGRRVDGGVTSWIRITRPDRVEIVIERPAQVITLTPPGETIEPLAVDHDVPYLAPLPTMKRTFWKEVDDGQGLAVDDVGGAHLLLGPPWYQLVYQDPEASGVEVQQVYKAALEQAGWTITASELGGITTAHYTRHGRDVWVKVSDGNMRVQVVDVGAVAAAAKLEAALMKDGHVALYGIYFDTDKDTLKPSSEASLRQIAQLLALRPKLRLEIQGHTDAVGARDHNQALSDARAAAVQKWLVDHQIDPRRLVAKGYADAVPVADNQTEQGRAKNRRVELVKLP